MPKQITKNQRYVNISGRTGVNSRYDSPIKNNTSPGISNITYINGVPIEREKAPKGEYSDAFLRLIYSIYLTYFTSVGRTMRKKVNEMNKLEIETKTNREIVV